MKGTTSLSLRKGRYAYSSPDAKLAVADQDTLALREGGLSLSLKGDKVAMRTEEGRVTVASSGDKIAVVSRDGSMAATGGLLREKGPDALQIVSEEIAKIGYTPS